MKYLKELLDEEQRKNIRRLLKASGAGWTHQDVRDIVSDPVWRLSVVGRAITEEAEETIRNSQ